MDCKWVLYGLMGGAKVPEMKTAMLGEMLRKRIMLQGTTLRNRTDLYKSLLIQDFVKEIDLGNDKLYKPVLDPKVFVGLDKVDDALNYLEENKTVGKVIISIALY